MRHGIGRLLGIFVAASGVFFLGIGEGKAFTLLDGNFELKGYIRNITAVRTEEPKGGLGGDQFKKNEVEFCGTTLNIDAEYRLSPEWKVYGRWRGSYDASFDFKGQDKFPQEVVDDQRVKNQVRELFVDYKKGPLLVRVGKQLVVWGEADALRLADLVNPLDASFHFGQLSPEDARIALPMVRAIYGLTLDTDLEFIWAPVSFVPQKFSGKGTYWEYPGAGIGGFPEKDYPTNINNGSVGGKIKTKLAGIDLSLFDYYRRLDAPSLEITSLGPMFVHPFVNSTGLTFNASSSRLGTVFRGEAVYNRDEPQMDMTKPNFISKKNSVAALIGIDRPTLLPISPDSTMLSFQAYHKRVLDVDPTTVTFGNTSHPGEKAYQTLFTFLFAPTYNFLIPNSTVSPQLFVEYDVEKSGIIQPSVGVKYGDNLNIAVGFTKFFGTKGGRGVVDPFVDRSEAYIDVKYSFM